MWTIAHMRSNGKAWALAIGVHGEDCRALLLLWLHVHSTSSPGTLKILGSRNLAAMVLYAWGSI